MKKSILTFVSLWLINCLAASAASMDVVVKEGNSEIIRISNLNRVMVRDENVVKAKTTNHSGEIMITGENFGETEVYYWREGEEAESKLHVTVTPRYWEELHDILADFPQIKVSISGQKILLQGMVDRHSDLEALEEARRLDPERIINLAVHDPEMAAERIEERLHSFGFSGANVNVAGNTAHLSGLMYDKAKLQEAVDVASSEAEMLNLEINDKALLVGEANILVNVQFVEVSMSKAREVGVDFGDLNLSADATYADGRLTSSTWDVRAGIRTQATIRTLIESGAANVSTESNFSTKSGEPARFQQGGTIYREIAVGDTIGVEPINYGFIVSAEPKLLSRDKLETKVEIESSLPSGSGDDLDISKYSTSSTFTIEPGEAMVLSGLKQILQAAGESDTPIFSRIPVLGRLFSVVSEDEQDMEALLVITVDWDEADPDAQERIRQLRERGNINTN